MTIWVMVWIEPARAGPRLSYTWAQKFASLRVAGPFVLLFMLVTGLIYMGIATPVEASAIGAMGALVFTLISGKLSWAVFANAVVRSCSTSAMIGLIVICAHIFGFFITATGATQQLMVAIGAAGFSPYTVLALLVVLYLVLGCFLDQLSILILTIPITLPVITQLGFDPIWFGILVVLLAEVGMVTPPVGLNVFIVARSSNMPVGEVFSGVWPHVVAHIGLITVMIVFPQIILWLPSTMKG